MAVTLAQEMARLSIKPSEVDTHVALMFDDLMDPEKITSAHLRITARSHHAQSDRFQAAVEAARRACAIWNALKLNLTCEAELISAPEPALL
jgi:organic hydroperoxide reductase OsmC/OhrA